MRPLFVGGVALVLLLAAVTATVASQLGLSPAGEVVYCDGMLVEDRDYADTVDDLLGSSTTIALGRLEGDAREISRSSDGKVIHLANDFTVEQLFKGRGQPGDVIPVLRSVGADQRCTFREADADPLIVGERYVLMLTGEGDLFIRVGASQGSFTVAEERLVPMNEQVPTSGALKGKTLDALAVLVTETP
ncbi:MAG: hypothetical protein H0X16_11630 [Chloroflexi bacterium]|nr:hypothetical protein [Chloroflexota bacterium]